MARLIAPRKTRTTGTTGAKGGSRKKSNAHLQATEVEEIKFQAEPTMDARSFQEHLILLYGAVKIGKTTLLSYFPGVYFLPTEPGYKDLKVRKTPISNWATFVEVVKKLKKNPKVMQDVELLVIDTITNLSKFCMQKVCADEGVTHPSDQEWGKGWAAFADEFAYWILQLASIGPGIAFIAHADNREIVSRSMKVTVSVPDLPKTTYRVINNICDVIMHMDYVTQGNKGEELGVLRCLYTKPSEVRDAGDRTGKLPSIIKFRTEEEAVEKIMGYFSDTVNPKPKKRVSKVAKKKTGKKK